MALIKCPECNKEISDKASSCPHCGYPLEKKETKKVRNKEPKKRFSSKEYKLWGLILGICCSVLLLILLLGITFNNIIISLIITVIYGGIIFILCKTLLTNKKNVKKYLWLIVLIGVTPLVISFVLLCKNEEWQNKHDYLEYEVRLNKVGGCTLKYKSSTEKILSKKCTYKQTEGKDYYHISVVTKDNKEHSFQCYYQKEKLKCSNPFIYSPMNEWTILEKK